MSDNEQMPPLHLDRADPRKEGYLSIAKVHAAVVAQMDAAPPGKPLCLDPRLVLHCEGAGFFLAQELLELRAMVEEKLK